MGILFTLMFTLVPLFIGAVFVFVIGMFVVAAVKGVAEWTDNNAQPVLTVPARIATKRLHVSGGGQDSGYYYITFETLAGGLRQEFAVTGTEYSGLAEGDTGDLTHQGSRYKSFARARRPVAPPLIVVTPRAPAWTCGYCATFIDGAERKCPSCGATERTQSATA